MALAAVTVPAKRTPRLSLTDDKKLKSTMDKLSSIKKEIETRRKKMSELEKVEGNYLARLEFLESNIRASRDYLALLTVRIDTAESTIVRLNDSMTTAQVRLSDRQAIMQRRLRMAYMTGTVSPFMVLFMAGNPLDIVHRVRYIEGVNRYDRQLASQIDSARTHIDREKRSFESERSRLARLLADKKTEQAMLVNEEKKRKKLLENVRLKKKSNQAMIAELNEAQQELAEMIRLLQQKRKKGGSLPPSPGTSGFARLKGALPWPHHGEITARYGRIVHPLYQTVTMNNGIDIRSSAGGPVLCVAAGTVMYTGSMRGLGKIVIVDHGGNYLTIYARLDAIETTAGSRLSAGTPVGSVRSGAQVHFEIRRSTESFDPAAWLKQR
jgi:septal ring factor EnvC (AmiA/AmiB activator)